MTTTEPRSSRRAIVRIALGMLILLTAPTAWLHSDDTFLFRTEASKPFVYVIFDTSSSMNLSPQGGSFVDANADDPSSTFYQAKKAVYEVFNQAFQQNGDFIHFGFMSYNQDELRVRGKHWLYRFDGGAHVHIGDGNHYPVQDERLVFGADLPVTATPDPARFEQPALGYLGTCQNPVNFSQNRALVNRFPKLHPVDYDGDGFMDNMLWHKLWLEDKGKTYLLMVETHSDASGNFPLGDDELLADFSVYKANAGCTSVVRTDQAAVKFKLETAFLMHDLVEEEDLQILHNAKERDGGIWNYQDAEARATCGDDQHPFTGMGYESNYDGGTFVGDPQDFPVEDPFCIGADCDTLKFATTLDPNTEPEYRTQDVGDMLPYHWERTNRNEFFRRLVPNWTPGKPLEQLNFGVASYFKDVPNAEGFLELINPNHRPMVPFGASPIGKCLADWRCFYLGANQSGGKCRVQNQPFGDGFDDLAAENDLEWGCRKPFILVIGDGEDNCMGENPGADTANLRRNSIQAWVINFGGPDSQDLRRLAQNSGGEYIAAANDGELIGALQNIVGQIIEQSRSFASAVVPTVQAEEDDKVFISDFKPLNNAPVWPGNVRAFLKPVPLNADGTPDPTTSCAADPDGEPGSECFLWNAGESMLAQVQNDIANQFGDLPTQRRVYYSQLSDSGDWPNGRRFFAPTNPSTAAATRYDLWRGFGLITAGTADGSLSEIQENDLESTANSVIASSMAMKNDPNGTPNDASDDLPFILGDIFHSDPLLLGSPPNSTYFALDLEGDGTACADGNPSYRCFFRDHQKRRKVMLLGSSDGMVHALDTGIFRDSGGFEDRFDRGTGREVFGFVPRSVMPKIKGLFADGFSRNWLVDGTIVGADVFIDPLDNGLDFPAPADREWRTIVISGLREGGRGYYALDVTQPDAYGADGAPTGVDGYVPSCSSGGAGCGTLAYPSQLWEFTDGLFVGNPPRMLPFDKDFDGIEDLADGWSTPNIGRIRICNGDDCDESLQPNDLEDRYVAIFGGGFDRTSETGDWLYMVDTETGKALYKQRLLDTDGASSGGSAPSEPAAVDTDSDGYLDRIYIGTTRGLVFRVDLRGPNGEIPRLGPDFEKVSVGGAPVIIPVQRITADEHAPRVIFKAQLDPSTPAPASHAFYYRPSVVFAPSIGQYVLAFGIGDRDDLWTADGGPGQFYLVRDDIATGDSTTFYTESDLVAIDGEVGPDQTEDLLTNPALVTKGWYLVLRPNERLISNPFVVSGVVIFSVFEPDVAVDLDALTCARTGKSRVFGVNATNANGLLFAGGERTRWFDIADFVTEPFVEQSLTKNRERSDGGANADQLSEDQGLILEELKKLFPKNCRFTNQRLDIKTLSSDTGLHLIAPVPICTVEKNWKEF